MNLRISDIEVRITNPIKAQEYMTAGSMDDVFLSQLNQVIEDNLGNEQFTVEELADSVAYSRSQLHRKVQKLTKQSISQYIRNIRLQHGMEMLEGNEEEPSPIEDLILPSEIPFSSQMKRQMLVEPWLISLGLPMVFVSLKTVLLTQILCKELMVERSVVVEESGLKFIVPLL